MGRTRLVESLESRQLLSATMAVTSKGTLVITGTSSADDITVSLKSKGYVLTNNQRDVSFTFLGTPTVKRLQIDLQGGGDKLLIDDSVTKPVIVTGGNGDDQLVSESANVTLSGGNGNDYLLIEVPESLGKVADRNEPPGRGTWGRSVGQVTYETTPTTPKPAGPRGAIQGGASIQARVVGNIGQAVLAGGNGNDALESNASGTYVDGNQGTDTAIVRDRVVVVRSVQPVVPAGQPDVPTSIAGNLTFSSTEVNTRPLGVAFIEAEYLLERRPSLEVRRNEVGYTYLTYSPYTS